MWRLLDRVADVARPRRAGGPSDDAARRRLHLSLPEDRTIAYAIGDVHGCLDLLLAIEREIIADASSLPDFAKVIVLIGDVIDRGPSSADVIDHLIDPPPAGFSRIVLAGNHEEAMLSFLADPTPDALWLAVGGIETLRSYGVKVDRAPLGRREARRLAMAATAAIPEEHLEFLRALPVAVVWGRFLFVHAGLRPGIPFDRQSDRDLQEVRGVFTESAADHGYLVVHGHTPNAAATLHANRVALDVASYATGRIAAARIGEGRIEFLTATAGG